MDGDVGIDDTQQRPNVEDGVRPEVAQSAAEAERAMWLVGLILFHLWLQGVLTWNTRLELEYTYGAVAAFWLLVGSGKLWVRAVVCGTFLLMPFPYDRIVLVWPRLQLGATMAGSFLVTLTAASIWGRFPLDNVCHIRFSTWQLMKTVTVVAVAAVILRSPVIYENFLSHAWGNSVIVLADNLLFGVVTGIACLPLLSPSGAWRRWCFRVAIGVVALGEVWQRLLWEFATDVQISWSFFTFVPTAWSDIPVYWLSAGVVWVTGWLADRLEIRWLHPWQDEATA